MSDTPAARRMQLIETLAEQLGGIEWGSLAARLGADERTIRRDVQYVQDLLGAVGEIEVRRGKVVATRVGFGAGYFASQIGQQRAVKERIAQAVVVSLEDNTAVVITAGSTTYYVARAIRQASVNDEHPHGLISFTNSLPALHELIAGGVSTGLIGDVYDPEDAAFHSHEVTTAFHPAVAIVGASGIVTNPGAGTLELFSHRAEEAAFMKQLLARVPEIIIAADSTKIGRRHPWSFTDRVLLAGKTVKLYTNELSSDQRTQLNELAEIAPEAGYAFGVMEQRE